MTYTGAPPPAMTKGDKKLSEEVERRGKLLERAFALQLARHEGTFLFSSPSEREG